MCLIVRNPVPDYQPAHRSQPGNPVPLILRLSCTAIAYDRVKIKTHYSPNGNCSIVKDELWAILHGAQTATSRGFKRLLIETDSLVAVYLINKGCHRIHACYSLVHAIREIIPQTISCNCSHIFRETNGPADALAKFGLSRLTNDSFDCDRWPEVQESTLPAIQHIFSQHPNVQQYSTSCRRSVTQSQDA
ncbi:hypothetical protein CR513_37080, partial [Mucuna pruriens]